MCIRDRLHTNHTHIIEMGDLVLVGKIPGSLTQLGCLDILAWSIVVQNDADFILIENLRDPCLLYTSRCV